MVELADTGDLKSPAVRHKGSIPFGTIIFNSARRKMRSVPNDTRRLVSDYLIFGDSSFNRLRNQIINATLVKVGLLNE